ncbi:MAG: toll/interleukin-1 receptor domain-containing protein [Elainellaceae cyanobacterium]
MTERPFDVFLAHSSKDKPLIRQIYRQLKARGITPWLDEEEIAPGTQFQDEIQQAIGQIKTAVICIGKGNLGRWQALELKAFISQCVERDIPVIPVLLPGVELIPTNLLFLREFHAVSFHEGIEDERAFFQLEWGITGRKPTQSSSPSVSPLRLHHLR